MSRERFRRPIALLDLAVVAGVLLVLIPTLVAELRRTRRSDARSEVLSRLDEFDGHIACDDEGRISAVYLQDSTLTDDDVALLAGLTHLNTVDLFACKQITDKSLAGLRDLPALRELNLVGTQVGDAGLAHVAAMTQLRSLQLGGTQVTDAGMQHLARLEHLESLAIDRTDVTDAGLRQLAGLANLRLLLLDRTRVTENGVKVFRQQTRSPRVAVPL